MVKSLSFGYPDQEWVSTVLGRAWSAKNAWPKETLLLGTNHQSGMKHWRFVDKANASYKAQGTLFGGAYGAHVADDHALVTGTVGKPKQV